MAIQPASALPVAIFVVILLAYTIQAELAQYVQQSLGYHQPYFLFWLTHSGYILLLPLHLLGLSLQPGPGSIDEALAQLRAVLKEHYKSQRKDELSKVGAQGRGTLRKRMSTRQLLSRGSATEERTSGWRWNLIWTSIKLSVFIAIPSCTWYTATALTSMTEITAIYNVFAFWAYLLSVKMLGEPASSTKLASVLLAIGGVLVISFGGAAMERGPTESGSHPLIGDLLALIGSLSFAYYEVWYKINISLKEPPADELDDGVLDELLGADDDEESDVGPARYSSPSLDSASPPQRPSPSRGTSTRSVLSISDNPATHPSSSTMLLYSSLLTTLMGLATLFLLWLPIPLLHYTSLEVFRLPARDAVLPIVGVLSMGVIFNGGFMLLISIWGPLVASVGNLCTLILVAFADTIVTGVPLPWTTLLGSGMVCGAFAGLIVAAKREDGTKIPGQDKDLGDA